jgi:signal transduction histidine kinase
MPFMWGQRWGHPFPGDRPPPPPAIRDQKFWEGTVFGVAVGARSFRGIIAVHADADYILDFRREIGVERQLAELGRRAGVDAIALLGPDLAVLAHSDRARHGERWDDRELEAALAGGRGLTRVVGAGAGGGVLEVVRPFAVEGGRPGLLVVGLSTEPMERTWHRGLLAGVLVGGAVLLLGALGLGIIFYAQQRHLREVRGLEQAMARRERVSALGDVAAAFAHEVRNPLNAVSVGLQRLGSEFAAAPADDHERLVGLMQGEVRRLNAIVEQFLSLARPLPLAPAPFAVPDLLEEIATLVEGDACPSGVTVRVDVPAEAVTVTADRDHLKQVLLNLALNGLQAMEKGGTLTLSAGRAREDVTVAVEDTGTGIPAELLPRVFDPYFTTRARGLGLGLAIARRIVEEHGGSITVESRPGHGSRFAVRLSVGPP